MAEKRSYLRAVTEKEKEQYREDYRDKIRRHRLSSVYRLMLVLAAIVVLIAIVYVQYKNHIYTSYDIVSETAFTSISDSEMLCLGENVVTYSHDGIRCTNAKGEVLWNQTFEMQNIMTTVCEDVIAIADYNGRQIYVLDSTQKICEITTTMPIRGIAVAGNGRVAVAVADTKITWIYIYDPDGSPAYEVRTTMGQSGYPVSFSLSPNGELLGVSCVYVDAGAVESRIAFYNFGSVGSNKSDYLVKADTYPDTIIPYICFTNSNTAVAVGEDRLLIYKGTQTPVLDKQHILSEEIQAVYYNEEYIGLMLHTDRLDMQYKMDIYEYSAEEKRGSYYFNLDYENIFFTEDYFVAYNSSECVIQTLGGVNKFEGEFLSSVDLMCPVGKGKSYKFILASKDGIKTIQLK